MEPKISSTQSPIQMLPVELLVDVIGRLARKADVARACLVSRLFSSISLPVLYRTLSIETKSLKKWNRQLGLFRTLCIPRISNLVIQVEVSVYPESVCKSRARPPQPCDCDVYDNEVGQALCNLDNLQKLTFRCDMCQEYGHHSYLLDGLYAPQLREFRFHCSCLRSEPGGDNRPTPSSLIAAPYMKTVTSLSLGCSDRWFIDATGTCQEILRQNNILPNLNTLQYFVSSGDDKFRFPTELVAARPIARLHSWGPPIVPAIIAPEKQLEYLIMDDVLRLLPIMKHHLGIYANIKFIGTITLRSSEEKEIVGALEPLSALRFLEGIEINKSIALNPNIPWDSKGPPKYFEPSQSLLRILGQRNHSLWRIYRLERSYETFGATKATLWERNRKEEEDWISRAVPEVGKWELLKGAIDNF